MYLLFLILITSLIISDTSLNSNLSDSLTDKDNDNMEYLYIGNWPENPIDSNYSSNIFIDCPNGIGCDCKQNNDCVNNNCQKTPKGNFCTPKNGDKFPNFIGIDQFEEYIPIHTFANQNKYILVEMGASWCTPCHLLSNWISYKDNEIQEMKWWKNDYNDIYDMIHNNEIYYITVLYEDEFKDNASFDTVYQWYNNYPDDLIPILADENKFLHRWIKPTGIPAIILLDESLQIVEFSTRGINKAFDKLLQIKNTNKKNK